MQEGQRNPLYRHQVLSGHHDHLWLSGLLPVPPAFLLHDWENGEKTTNLNPTSGIKGPTFIANWTVFSLTRVGQAELTTGSDFPRQKGCNNLLKGYARASQANMTVRGYESIFCSNMMKINQDIFRNSLKEKMIDIFMENSERLWLNQTWHIEKA